ncbi:MAG: hypothetical protein KAT77_02350 [Nanoarchaeota archaeon]|nr:hypothetical protein [Nanoarchaeota archaeon]
MAKLSKEERREMESAELQRRAKAGTASEAEKERLKETIAKKKRAQARPAPSPKPAPTPSAPSTPAPSTPAPTPAQAKESYWKRMRAGERLGSAAGGIRDIGSGLLGLGAGGAEKAASLPESWFILLVLLGALGSIFKRYMGYNPATYLSFSIILLVIFLMTVRHNKTYVIIVLVTFFIDTFGTQLPLYSLPDMVSFIKGFLAFANVFSWFFLSLILFWLNYSKLQEEGKETSWLGWIIVVGTFLLLIFYTVPALKNTLQTHTDYFGIAEEQYEEVKEITQARVEEWKEVYYRFGCSLSQPMDIEECTMRKIAEVRCKPFKDAGETKKYEECIKTEMGLGVAVTGIVDPVMDEPLELVWEQGPEFGKTEIFLVGVPTFTAKLKVKNPRKDRLDLKLSCSFADLVDKENVSGSIFSTLGEDFTFEEKSKEIEVVCSPLEILEAGKRYRVTYEVELVDFSTKSKLQMLFIGGGKKDKIKRMFKSDYFLAGKSRAAKDLARLNLDMGKEGYIEGVDVIQLASSVENIGGGEITNVKKVEIDLLAPGIGVNDLVKTQPCTLEGETTLSIHPQVILSQKRQKVILGGVCFLRLGSALKNPEEFLKVVEFHGDLVYSYQTKGEFFTPTIKVVGTG